LLKAAEAKNAQLEEANAELEARVSKQRATKAATEEKIHEVRHEIPRSL
jgi:hypothetical protein